MNLIVEMAPFLDRLEHLDGESILAIADAVRSTADTVDGEVLWWRSTVVVVISEFGRTFRENGTRGTDHGHGTVYWVLGGAVRGSRIAGDQVAVERATLNQDRDWPVLNEYRALLGGLFKTGFDLQFSTPVIAGIVLIIAIAVGFDLLLVLLQRLLTPWAPR